MNFTLLRKITVKGVFGPITRPNKGDKPVDIMHVLGNVSGVRELEDKFKPGELSYALRGNFEATNLETGEMFTAPECFLPEPTQSMLVEQIKKGEVDVQFVITISYKHSETAIGYEYVSKPHMKPTGVDILANLRAALPQLSAPVAKDKGKKAA